MYSLAKNRNIVSLVTNKIVELFLKSKGISIQVKDQAIFVHSDKPLVISSNLLVLNANELHLNPELQETSSGFNLINTDKGENDGHNDEPCSIAHKCSCE